MRNFSVPTWTATLDVNKTNLLRAAAILGGGILVSWLIIITKPSPQPEAHLPPPPHRADVQLVTLESRAVTVVSQGTVTPKVEIDITAQVGGEVVAVADNFAAGGYFSAGEPLLTIDPRDYETALARAEAALADARRQLAMEQGQALQAKREWRDLGNRAANDLSLRKPQLAAAEAGVRAAEAGVRQARLDLERTAIALPFAGRVISVAANLGQFVPAGSKVGRVYASATMEVRLPLSAREMHLLNLNPELRHREMRPLAAQLRFDTGAEVLEWQARVVRVESSADTSSRLFYVVAEIDDKTLDKGGRIPIIPGIFVEAAISSNPYPEVVALPRSALYQNDQVMVLDGESRLRLQQVEVLQLNARGLVVRGLDDGQQVLTKPPGFIALGAVYTPVVAAAEDAGS